VPHIADQPSNDFVVERPSELAPGNELRHATIVVSGSV
jgi:hypothetical protein